MSSRLLSNCGKPRGGSLKDSRRRIKAPEIDTSALIRENALTAIGRVTNPAEQPVEALILALPRKWTLKGRVTGSDLGHNTFQFRFELEEDLVNILAARPYQYARWMVVLQRWEPILSPLFPSQIPFWISLHGLPLHYWHEKMIYEVGQDLGILEDYRITKTSAKIKVMMDALKPLTKEAMIAFAADVELPITLEYDGLDLHCLTCNCLTHLASDCPQRSDSEEIESRPSYRQRDHRTFSPTGHRIYTERYPNQRRHEEKRPARLEEPFNQRLDRHGKPFGERLTLPDAKPQPLRNKITPHYEEANGYHQEAQRRQTRNNYASLPQARETLNKISHPTLRNTSNHAPNLQWRVRRQRSRSPIIPPANQEPDDIQTPPPLPPTDRIPLERNLELTDYPGLPEIPTTEQVMEDLREVTFQYTNVSDPVERAARVQRVIQGEEQNMMAETAANIIATAMSNLAKRATHGTPRRGETPRRFESTDIPESSNANARRTREARRIPASPRIFSGASSSRRLLSQAQSQTPSARHGFPHASPILQQRSLTSRQNDQETGNQRSSQDFHGDRPQLP